MTTLTNLFNGNFPAIQAELGAHTSTYFMVVEGDRVQREHAVRLFDFSLRCNSALLKDRNVILIDFGLKWLQDRLGAAYATNSATFKQVTVETRQNERLVLQDMSTDAGNMYGMFFFNGVSATGGTANSSRINLAAASEALVKFVNEVNNKPCVIFVRNTETLELFQPLQEIAMFFQTLQHNTIKQIFVQTDSDTMSARLQQALQHLATQHVLVKGIVHSKQPKIPHTSVLTTVKKANGYCFQENFFINLTDGIKVEKKIDLWDESAEQGDSAAQDAAYQTTFSVKMSYEQKRSLQGASIEQKKSINPHLSAQIQEHDWDHTKYAQKGLEKQQINKKSKQGAAGAGSTPERNLDDLIQLEGEDVDNELEEGEDLDV